MSVRTRMRPINVEISLEGEILRFVGVPSQRIKPILVSLQEYKEETIPWREIAKDRIKGAGGESAYFTKLYRKQAKLTQVQLAEKLKMPQSNLSQIERGKRPVGKMLAKRLAKVFGVNYRVFL